MANLVLLGSMSAFDLMLLGSTYFGLKSQTLEIRRQLMPLMAVGTSGFVFHAFLFFSGAILILQLAALLGMWGIAWYLTLQARNESP